MCKYIYHSDLITALVKSNISVPSVLIISVLLVFLNAEAVSIFGIPGPPVLSLSFVSNPSPEAIHAKRHLQTSSCEIAAYMHSKLGRLCPYSVRMFGEVSLTP